MKMENYTIEVDRFEGPLDLLLHLIRKSDIDIHDIPIAFILDRYLEYLSRAEELNVDLAGEFIYTASELAYIKSRMLLPPEASEEEDEGPDPRADLVQRLIEYEKYKRASQWLEKKPLLDREVFGHPTERFQAGTEDEEELEVDLSALLSAFQRVWNRLPKDRMHEVKVDRLSVSERMVELVDQLKGKKEIEWRAFFNEAKTRETLVVTFLAILEMAKLKMIRVAQKSAYGEIWIHSQLMEA
ncbi:MAG: segregation/condensation protein A [Deltaproteobacteria bacterium]|nr:segregation/condensation protein A [Deltaproteobacteria bacterium]